MKSRAMQLPRTPAAVIFDMDGLIFDTEALYRDAFFVTAARLGYALPMTMFLSLVGRPWDVNRAALRAYLPTDAAVEDFRAAWADDFRAMLETGLRVKPGVLELLDLLDRQGVPRAIATSSGHAEVRHHLGASGLEGRFHAVVAHGTTPPASPAPTPSCAPRRSWAYPPPIAWCWRIPMPASAPPMPPA
jgi:beta-phosphoglucomutase-like phosphatase (HAD superfamily)